LQGTQILQGTQKKNGTGVLNYYSNYNSTSLDSLLRSQLHLTENTNYIHTTLSVPSQPLSRTPRYINEFIVPYSNAARLDGAVRLKARRIG
jgi:hypothetical protein